MRCYPEHKESGVEFIGEIPKAWRLTKLKYVAQIDNSGLWGEEQGMLDIDAPVSTTAHLTRGGDWLIKQMPIRSFSKGDYEYYSGKNGDIIIVKSSGSATNIITGKAGFIDNLSKGIVFSNFLMRVKPNREKYDPKLLYYFLTSSITIERIKRMVSTTTYPNLKVEEYISNLIPIPPSKDEQVKIAAFLDHKTGQIDELIRIKQRRIELLQEQRTALINQAVTKGLDPNVEMKPSGVEWIGEIPVHWEVIRNKFIFQQIKDVSYPNLLLLSIGIRGIIPKSQTDQKDVSSADKSLYKRVKIGDIAFNVMTAWKGGIGMSDYEGIVSPAYQVCRPTTKLVSKYFHYLFRTDLYKAIFDSASYQVVDQRHNLYYDNFKNISAIFPPFSEQAQITNFLDCKTQQLDDLLAAEQRKIELLTEYRQSLISEAVTGKIVKS